jgi:hypothetical protein
MLPQIENKQIHPNLLPSWYFDDSEVFEIKSKNNVHFLIDCHEDWMNKNPNKTYLYIISCYGITSYSNELGTVALGSFKIKNNELVFSNGGTIYANIHCKKIILKYVGEFDTVKVKQGEQHKLINIEDYD